MSALTTEVAKKINDRFTIVYQNIDSHNSVNEEKDHKVVDISDATTTGAGIKTMAKPKTDKGTKKQVPGFPTIYSSNADGVSLVLTAVGMMTDQDLQPFIDEFISLYGSGKIERTKSTKTKSSAAKTPRKSPAAPKPAGVALPGPALPGRVGAHSIPPIASLPPPSMSLETYLQTLSKKCEDGTLEFLADVINKLNASVESLTTLYNQRNVVDYSANMDEVTKSFYEMVIAPTGQGASFSDMTVSFTGADGNFDLQVVVPQLQYKMGFVTTYDGESLNYQITVNDVVVPHATPYVLPEPVGKDDVAKDLLLDLFVFSNDQITSNLTNVTTELVDPYRSIDKASVSFARAKEDAILV